MTAISSATGSIPAMGAGVRAMNQALLFQHVFLLAGLPDPSLQVAASQLAQDGRSLVEAGTVLAQHEAVGSLLDLVG